MKKLESTFPNMVIVLTLITLIAAAGLAAMYRVTEEPIAAAKQAKQEQAIREVLPPFDSLADVKIINETKVFRAFDKEKKIVGLAIETWASGFGGNIKMMVGIDVNGNIVDYSLLEHAETPGLGSKLTDWFKTKADIRGAEIGIRPFAVTKDGGEYDAITAATISSRAFMKAINKAVETYGLSFEWAQSEFPDAFSAATTLHERRMQQRMKALEGETDVIEDEIIDTTTIELDSVAVVADSIYSNTIINPENTEQ